MMLLIFIMTMVAAILFGGLMVKRAKKKLAEERERRLKIAEGKWDELDVPKPKSSKLGRALKAPWSGLKKIGSTARRPRLSMPRWAGDAETNPNDVGSPETALRLASSRIPPCVQETLTAWHQYTDGVEAVETGEASYVSAMRNLERTQRELSDRLNKGNLESWVHECQKAFVALRVAGREYAVTHDQLKPLRERWNKANRELDQSLSEVEEYCKRHMLTPEELSKEYYDIVQIAQVVKSECATVVDPPRHNRPPVGWGVSDLPSADAEGLAERLLVEVKAVLNSARNASHAHDEAVRGYESVKELLGSVSHEEPTKLTDQEVQGFVGSAMAWANTVQNYVLTAQKSLGQAMAARDSLAVQTHSLFAAQSAVIQAIRKTVIAAHAEQTRASEAQNAEADPATAMNRKLRRDVFEQHEAAAVARKQAEEKALRYAAWFGFSEAMSAPIDGVIKDSEIRSCLDTINVLSDRSRGLMELAYFVLVQSKALCEEVGQEPHEDYRLNRVIGTAPSAEPERNKMSALRNAMRKLGFAIAQSNAAAGKIALAEQQPTNLREPQEPDLDETNVDKYVRAFKRWTEDLSHNDSVSEARARKIEALKIQLQEREKQIAEAAEGIRHLLENPSFIGHNESVSAELDAALRAATMLCERYTNDEYAQEQEPPNDEGVEDVQLAETHELNLDDSEEKEEVLDFNTEEE